MEKRALTAIAIILALNIFTHSSLLKLSNKTIGTISMSKQTENIEEIISKFIPKDMELSPAMSPKRAKAIIYKDVDGDGEKEILFSFRSIKETNTGGLVLLKKENNIWKEVLKECGEGKLVYKVYYEDIDGDKKNELLIGSFMGVSAGNDLKIYKFDSKGILKLIGEEGFHKILIKDMPNMEGKNDGKSELAIWQHATGDAYVIKVLRYDKDRLVEARDVYPYYFPRVVDYYKSKLKKTYNKNSALMWYYLADSQLKANKPREALNTLYEAKKSSLDGYGKLKAMFNKLEKQAISSFVD